MFCRRFLLGWILVACGDATEDKSGDTDAAETDLPAATCTALSSGSWAVDGSCFGMPMGVELSMDAEECRFVLDDWSMDHGNSPTGGRVDGDEVTLRGGDFRDCTGTMDGDAISGTCPDGCAWELVFDE